MSFNHKVLQFQNSNNQNGVTSKEPVIGHDINKNKNIQKAEKFSKKNIILLSIEGLILIIVIIVFIALFANITEPQKCCDEPSVCGKKYRYVGHIMNLKISLIVAPKR